MTQEVFEINRGLERIKMKIEEMKKTISRPLIVGITGPSGSGKTTTVAKKIQAMFPNSKISSMDDDYRGRQYMESIGLDNFDDPRAVDLETIEKRLILLKMWFTVLKPVYCFKTGERKGYEIFEPAEIVIVEGLFALHEKIVHEIDLKIFVDISIHGSLLRRLIRDVARTGQTESEIFRQYVEAVYPMYKLHVEPTKSRADIVIINQYVPEIEAENCLIREIQIKAALKARAFLEKLTKLSEMGFKKIATVFQKDTYYMAPNWDDSYLNELMRIRKEGDRYFLAYKGPLKGGVLRIKPKIEFEVEPRLKDALEKLGYKELLVIKKQREKFLGEGLELVADKIEGGGCFLEFRTPNPDGEALILKCLEKLNIDKNSITKKSYLELMLDRNKSL